MKEKLYLVARAAGIFWVCRWLTRNNVRILAYHGIWLGEGHFGNHLFMSPAKFSSRMRLLKRLGYPILRLEDALSGLKDATNPSGTTVITIDDGWQGSYECMLPALEEHAFPAMLYAYTYYSGVRHPVFNVAVQYVISQAGESSLSMQEVGVNSQRVFDLCQESGRTQATELLQKTGAEMGTEEERQSLVLRTAEYLGVDVASVVNNTSLYLLTNEQLSEMSRRGVDIQLHTHNHTISNKGVSVIGSEIEANRNYLAPLVCHELTHFCYPSGVYDKDVWPELRSLGIKSATTTKAGLVNGASEAYALPRILDGEAISDLEFEAELAGFGEMIRKLKGVLGL